MRSLPAMATAGTGAAAAAGGGNGVGRTAGGWGLAGKAEGLLAEGLKIGLEGALGGGAGRDGVTLASRM